MRAVGKAINPLSPPTSSTIIRHQLAQTDPAPSHSNPVCRACKLISSCHPCKALPVVGGAQNRALSRPPQRSSFCVQLDSGLQFPSLLLSLGFLRVLLARHGLARDGQCAGEFCLWSHPSRGRRCFVGLVVRYQKGGWNFVFSDSPGLVARGPLSSGPAMLGRPGRLGDAGSFLGGNRLLRSGGPCIRPKQLALPVSPDPPWLHGERWGNR